jgi:hypothetical protein
MDKATRVLTSKARAGIPRMVCVYCPSLWGGPQPGVVVNGPSVFGTAEVRLRPLARGAVVRDAAGGVVAARADLIVVGDLTGDDVVDVEDVLAAAQTLDAAGLMEYLVAYGGADGLGAAVRRADARAAGRRRGPCAHRDRLDR